MMKYFSDKWYFKYHSSHVRSEQKVFSQSKKVRFEALGGLCYFTNNTSSQLYYCRHDIEASALHRVLWQMAYIGLSGIHLTLWSGVGLTVQSKLHFTIPNWRKIACFIISQIGFIIYYCTMFSPLKCRFFESTITRKCFNTTLDMQELPSAFKKQLSPWTIWHPL